MIDAGHALQQQEQKLLIMLPPNSWKAFIVKQLQEVLRMCLLTKHGNDVDQKPARRLSCR